MPKSYTSRSKTHSYREVMKKIFFVGFVSLLACTADANAAQIHIESIMCTLLGCSLLFGLKLHSSDNGGVGGRGHSGLCD